MRLITQCLIFTLILFLVSESSWGENNILNQNLLLDGKNGAISINPLLANKIALSENSTEYTIYDIDYDELKRQIKIYKRIYVTGQLLHGALMVKTKSKFVD